MAIYRLAPEVWNALVGDIYGDASTIALEWDLEKYREDHRLRRILRRRVSLSGAAFDEVLCDFSSDSMYRETKKFVAELQKRLGVDLSDELTYFYSIAIDPQGWPLEQLKIEVIDE